MLSDRHYFSSYRPSEKREGFFASLDYRILVPALLLTLIGLFVLNQVLRDGYGYGSYPGNFYKQCGAAMVGLFLALLIAAIEEPTLRLLSYFIYGGSLLLLIWVKIDGYSLYAVTGADSWMQLPFIGTFQPSELAKIGIAMVGAQTLEGISEHRQSMTKGLIHYALVYFVPLLLILKEPDFGTGMVIICMMVAQLFVWGVRWRYIFIAGAGVMAFLPVFWFTYLNPLQKQRVLSLIFPGHELSQSYHVDQALKAIAAGGLAGRRSDLDIYVPVKESDFLYSAISEHLGFIGTTAVILLSMYFLWRLVHVALKIEQHNYAASLTIMALMTFIAIHFIENMGMNVRLLPVTGIPLPFMSNGGTALLINYLALGIFLNYSLNQRSVDLLE